VAQAGRIGQVTIATNMAGRGTDILLGGNPEFVARKTLVERGLKPSETPAEEWDAAYTAELALERERCAAEHARVIGLGGLYILGTERHESRRVDNQLRGRAGRQGDPGASRFFLSLDDDLMRIFAGDRLKAAMKRLGMEEDVPIESPLVTRSIERAQKQVEQRNFEIRKHLLEYDDVNNEQRREIYRQRRELLSGKEQRDYVLDKGRDILNGLLDAHLAIYENPAERETAVFREQVRHNFGFDPEAEGVVLDTGDLEDLGQRLWDVAEARYAAKEVKLGEARMRQYERNVLLQVIDGAWKDHLLAMDHLKEGIGLRAYGQRDPLVEYKRESFDMFTQMKERIENEAVRFLFLVEPMTEEERARIEERRRREQSQVFAAASRSASGITARGGVQTVTKTTARVGRNDPCPCGSGKKYKKCHGTAA